MVIATTSTAQLEEVLDSVVKEPQHVVVGPNPKYPQSLRSTTTKPSANSSLSPIHFPSGTRSPSSGSMPSSPTSIHSSSSAIFERDIEQPLSATPLALQHNKDPHHTARALVHEPLENAVPSVLDAAVSVLGELDTSPKRKGMSVDEISVIAPSPLSPANWTSSTNASIRHGISRSPSPSPNVVPLPSTSPTPSRFNMNVRSAVPQRLNTAGSGSGIVVADPQATPHAADTTSTPSVIGIVPPTPNANSFGFSRGSPSPQSATASPLVVTPPLPNTSTSNMPIPRPVNPASSRSTSRPTSIAMSLEELSLAPLVTTTADSDVPVPADVEPIALSGHHGHRRPPSPNDNAKNRLSFISYNDMLNSTPVSAFSLGTVVTNAGASVEPPHHVTVRSRTVSRQSTMNRSPVSDVFGAGAHSPPSILAAATTELERHESQPAATTTTTTKTGGEWQREGFGTGLEERLEAALKEQQSHSASSSPTAESTAAA